MKKTLAIVLWLILLIICCGTFRDFEQREEVPEPASVCDYKLALIWRGQFRPREHGEKDFYNSVTAQVEWLWKHDYTVFKLKYEYGFTVTHEEIVRCAVIFYRRNK
jgi:hypothetical protein